MLFSRRLVQLAQLLIVLILVLGFLLGTIEELVCDGGEELLDGRGHDVRGGMADEAQPFGGVGSNRSQGESLGSSGDRRSQIQKRIAGLAGNRRLEAFSALSLFQSIRTGRPVGDLNHFSFY